MSRSTRRRPVLAKNHAAVHESRRELQRTRAAATESRDAYMMIAVALALEQGGELQVTREMYSKIRDSHSVQLVPQDGVLRVVVTDLAPPKDEPTVQETSELEILAVEEPAA